MGDTYEKFLQRVFSAPDLAKLNDFNSEIQGFLATRMGLISFTNEQKKLQSSPSGSLPGATREGNGRREGTTVGGNSGPSNGGSDVWGHQKMPPFGREDNQERRFVVDELDDYEKLSAFLSSANRGDDGKTQGLPKQNSMWEFTNATHGENEDSEWKTSAQSISSCSFDAPSTSTFIHDGFQNAIGKVSDPPFGSPPNRSDLPSRATLASRPQCRTPTARGEDTAAFSLPHEKSIPPPLHGSLTRSVSHDYRTAGVDAVDSIVFTSALEDEFVSAGDRGVLSFHSIDPLESVPRLMKCEHAGPVRFVAVSSDFSLLASCGEDARLCVIDLLTKQSILVLYHPGVVTCATFSSNSQFILSGCGDSRCRLWRTAPCTAPREIATYCGLHDRVTAIELQTVGGLVACGSRIGEVHLWKGSTLELVHTIGEGILTSSIISVTFNWNNEILLSADMKSILFSDVRTGTALKLLVAGDWVSHLPVRGIFENVEKACFTVAGFAPKTVYPNYFLVGKGDCSIILYELRVQQKEGLGKEKKNTKVVGSPTGTSGGALVGEGSKGYSSEPSVEVQDVGEVWSTKLRAPGTCFSTGFSTKVIVGDVNGNAVLVNIEPSRMIRKAPCLIGNPKRVYLR